MKKGRKEGKQNANEERVTMRNVRRWTEGGTEDKVKREKDSEEQE